MYIYIYIYKCESAHLDSIQFNTHTIQRWAVKLLMEKTDGRNESISLPLRTTPLPQV